MQWLNTYLCGELITMHTEMIIIVLIAMHGCRFSKRGKLVCCSQCFIQRINQKIGVNKTAIVYVHVGEIIESQQVSCA